MTKCAQLRCDLVIRNFTSLLQLEPEYFGLGRHKSILSKSKKNYCPDSKYRVYYESQHRGYSEKNWCPSKIFKMDEDFVESDDRHEPSDVRVIDFDVDLASFPRFAAPFNQQTRPGLQQNTTTNTTGQQSTTSAASSTSRRPDKRFVDSVKRPGYHRKDRLFFSGVPPPVPPEGEQCLLDRLLLVSNLHWVNSISNASTSYRS